MRAGGRRLLLAVLCGGLLLPGGGLAVASPKAPPKVDLTVAMTDAPDPVRKGESLTYTVTVSNVGTAGATSVLVTDELPASLSFTSAQAPEGCSTSGQRVVCSLGSLAKGGSASAVIAVRAQQSGTIDNTAEASSAQQDKNTADNAATASTTVQEPEPEPEPPTPGDPDLPVGGCTGVLQWPAPSQPVNECRFISSGGRHITTAVSAHVPVLPVHASFRMTGGGHSYFSYSFDAAVLGPQSDGVPLAACGDNWPHGTTGEWGYYDFYVSASWGPPSHCAGVAEVEGERSRPLACTGGPCGTAQSAPRAGDILLCRASGHYSDGYTSRWADTTFSCRG